MPKKINAALAKTIGDRIDELISESGTSKIEVARALDVAPSQITRIIKGERYPSLELLLDMANYFKVSTGFLLGRE